VLRITVQDYHGAKRFIVEGKLAGNCVSELEKCWRTAGAENLDQGILVDLNSVTYIDDAGKQLLRRMYLQGIKLQAKGLLPKCLIAEIEHQP
jgi:anti-anti-sigma regulatory factor